MEIVKMCDTLGWTYQQYMDSPKWFIDLTVGKRLVESKHKSKT